MKKRILTSKLDLGLIMILIPYTLTIAWSLYGVFSYHYGLFSIENYKFVGKDPLLFILSSLSILAGFILLAMGYIESGNYEAVYNNIPAIAFVIIIFNLITSVLIAWMVSGNLMSGLSLVYSCQFILLYNFIITIFGLLMSLKYEKIDIKKAIKESAGEILLVASLGVYIIIRINYGPSFQLLLGSLAAVMIIIYLFFIRRS